MLGTIIKSGQVPIVDKPYAYNPSYYYAKLYNHSILKVKTTF